MNIKRKITILVLIIIAITGLIIYFIILPTINDIQKISQSIYAEKVDLEKKYQRGQLLRKTIEEFKQIEPEKERLKSAFIVEGQELEFITTLETIANSFNLVQSLQLRPSQGKKEKNYYLLPLQITTQGNFTDTLKYLKKLEGLNYYFNSSAIKISGNNQNDSITLVIDGQIYSLSQQQK